MGICSEHESWSTFVNDPNRGVPISNEATAEFEFFDISPIEVSFLLPALIEILSDSTLCSSLAPTAARELHQASEFVTRHNTYIQLRHLTSCTLGDLQEQNLRDLSPWMDRIERIPKQALNALAVVEDLQAVLNELKRLQIQVDGKDREFRAHKRHKGSADMIRLNSLRALCCVIKEFIVLEFRGRTWLLPFVLFLELYGKITELSNLLIYTHFSYGTALPSNHWEATLSFLIHCIEVLLQRRDNRPCQNPKYQQLENDNAGFIYLKTMEALGVGIISLREDMENFQEENRLLLDTIWSALMENLELYHILYPLESGQITYLIGTVKVMGHPSISVVEGLKQLNERVHRQLVIDSIS